MAAVSHSEKDTEGSGDANREKVGPQPCTIHTSTSMDKLCHLLKLHHFNPWLRCRACFGLVRPLFSPCIDTTSSQITLIDGVSLSRCPRACILVPTQEDRLGHQGLFHCLAKTSGISTAHLKDVSWQEQGHAFGLEKVGSGNLGEVCRTRVRQVELERRCSLWGVLSDATWIFQVYDSDCSSLLREC